jgi:glycosyltransferase involved in cell wall biosynthesis
MEHGYNPKLLVTKGYKPGRNAIKATICELPDQIRQNEVVVDNSFNEDVDKLLESFREHLKDVELVITHDTIYQPASLKHNVALRAYAEERKDLHFLHWIHSATSPYKIADLVGIFPEKYKEVVGKKFPRSYYVFFNNWSIPRIAREYNIPESLVKIVHHPTDYFKFAKYEPYSIELCKKHNLISKDFVMAYPARLDNGKQLEYGIKMMGALKNLGFSVHFIGIDFHSSSDDPRDPKLQYRNQLKQIAKEWGVESDVTFTSEFKPESKVRVPEGVVRDLMDISNVFWMSSVSESYSLVTQEAAMSGNLLVLNRNFPPFRELFGPDAIMWPCDSNVDIANISDGGTKVSYNGLEREDYASLAKEVVASSTNKQNLTRRRLLAQRNPDYIFTHELEPLIKGIKSDKNII